MNGKQWQELAQARDELKQGIISDEQFIDVHLDAIAAAVAQAVQQEREACRVAASKAIMRIRTDKMQDNTMAELRTICADAAEDAIRARGNSH